MIDLGIVTTSETNGMAVVDRMAPAGDVVVDYDRRHLSLYAELLDADDAGHSWQHIARNILRIDVNAVDAEACWRSHLDRARWIVGDGLAAAVTGFGSGTELSR